MGDFKDENGQSRVGKLLKDIGKGDFIEKAATMVGQGLSGNWFGAVQTLLSKDDDVTPAQEQAANDAHTLDLQDKANARDMYKSTDHVMADKVADRVITYNVWIVLAALIIEIASILYIDDKVLIAIISSAVGSITTALLQERQQVIGFFFGSSAGSKAKTLHAQKNKK